jgi:hypothetical protein
VEGTTNGAKAVGGEQHGNEQMASMPIKRE